VKGILAYRSVQAALPSIAAGYLKTARLCMRMVRDDSAKGEEILARGRPVVACFWHGRLLPVALSWRGAGADILISQSSDGKMIANTARKLGHGVIEGSTARGDRNRRSVQAGRDVVSKLRAGRYVGITPDGPRGPRMRASEGAIRLAQMGEVDLVPVTAALWPAIRAGSWDRMIVPLPVPFSKAAFLVGDPIAVPRAAKADERERLRLLLETEMNRLTAEADTLVGASVVQPAAPAAT
jgi:lysophospholipid acyltransferase (LPLAT)-like uncharacterized protein